MRLIAGGGAVFFLGLLKEGWWHQITDGKIMSRAAESERIVKAKSVISRSLYQLSFLKEQYNV